MNGILHFDENAFFSLASLLCVHQRQQQTPRQVTANDEGSSDDEGWDPDIESASIRDELLDCTTNDKRLIKFLDHIAETFSREKSGPRTHATRHERRRKTNDTKGKGATHVTASGLVLHDGQPTIYLAKNGVENVAEDEALARSLTNWIQAIAFTTERPIIDKDYMWTRLLTFYQQRLDLYASQIESSSEEDLTTAFLEGSDGITSARELYSLSRQYKMSKSSDTIRRMVSIAYILRYAALPITSTARNIKVRKSIALMGRLRAAYETFKNAAIEFQRSFRKLRIVCLPAPTARRFSRSSMERWIQELAKRNKLLRPKKKQLNKAWGEKAEILNPCHAEIQLLLHFECSVSSKSKPYPYIGCSKKSCWLCYQLMSRLKDVRTGTKGFYQTRGSHGQVYPRWQIALDASLPSDARIWFNLSVALEDIYRSMLEQLTDTRRTQRQAEAQSSANVTVKGGAIRRQALAKERETESSLRSDNIKKEGLIKKTLICSSKCIRFPALGKSPHILSIDLYDYLDEWPGKEPSNLRIPDFAAHWGKHHFDRARRRITIENQPSAELHGDYIVYWCRNAGLPRNQCMMSLVGIDSLPSHEHFWHGDVFMMRLCEDKRSLNLDYRDIPRTFLSHEDLIQRIVKSFWDDREAEAEIRCYQQVEEKNEKLNMDKHIILERM
jgi:hypothetical protein